VSIVLVKPSFSNSQILTVASSDAVASRCVWKGENLTSHTWPVWPEIKNWLVGTLQGLVESKIETGPPPEDFQETAKNFALTFTIFPSVILSLGFTSSNLVLITSPIEINCC